MGMLARMSMCFDHLREHTVYGTFTYRYIINRRAESGVSAHWPWAMALAQNAETARVLRVPVRTARCGYTVSLTDINALGDENTPTFQPSFTSK